MVAKKKTPARAKARKQGQRKVKRYSKAREDLQLAGVIATAAEGAVRSERVDPRSQDEQRFPGLDRLAIREGSGFNLTEPIKRKIVEVNAEVLYERRVAYDKDGKEIELPPDREQINKASRLLKDVEQMQWERDHPREAGQARGGVQVGVQVNQGPPVDPFELFRRSLAEAEVDEAEQVIQQVKEQANDQQEQGADDQGAGASGGGTNPEASQGGLHEPVLQEQATPLG